MNTQPEALRLADVIEGGWTRENGQNAAAELRRLHEVNQELLEALNDLLYFDNGKPEFESARAVIAKHGEQA